MPAFRAPLDDIRYLLNDVHDIGQLAALPGFEDATPEMIEEVLKGGARRCSSPSTSRGTPRASRW